MRVGDRAMVKSGKDVGKVVRIAYIYPGKKWGIWPYYFAVRLPDGKIMDATVKRLKSLQVERI